MQRQEMEEIGVCGSAGVCVSHIWASSPRSIHFGVSRRVKRRHVKSRQSCSGCRWAAADIDLRSHVGGNLVARTGPTRGGPGEDRNGGALPRRDPLFMLICPWAGCLHLQQSPLKTNKKIRPLGNPKCGKLHHS